LSGVVANHGGQMSQATAKKIGRFLILLGLINLIVVFAFEAFSKEVQVIDIRKNLKLNNDDKEFTDYYLNAGNDMGIKPGTLFTLYRRISVIDRLGTNQGRPLSIPVGKIKIIYVAKDLSVARTEKLEKNETSPLLDYRGVMLGDLINVGSAEMSKDEGKDAKYGPQGLDVSFQAQPIAIPQEDQRIPAAEEVKKPMIELKAETTDVPPNAEKASLNQENSALKIELSR
jgi:hypothetical protein